MKQRGKTIRVGRVALHPRFFLLVAIAIVCVAMGIFGLLKVLQRPTGPTDEAPQVAEINGVPVIRDLLPEEIPGRPGTLRTIRYVVIHETGNEGKNANAASHNNYIRNQAAIDTVSWHYTVDDHEIYQHLPDNEIGFHAGDQLTEDGGNMCGIGVELCVNPENDYEETLKNGAALAAHLLNAYDLPLKALKKHQDFSGKICPQRLIEQDRWEEFRQMVEAEMKAQKKAQEA